MRKKYFSICVLSVFTLALCFYLLVSKKILITFGADDVYVNQVVFYDNPIQIDELSGSNTPEGLLFRYFTAPDLDTYQETFIGREYPSMNVDEFDQWKQILAQGTLKVLGIVYIKINGSEYSLVQYVLETLKDESICGFFTKKINGKWYPCSSLEINRYRNIEMALEQHKLNSLSKYVLHMNELNREEMAYIKGLKRSFFQIQSLDGLQYITSLRNALLSEEAEEREFARLVLYPVMQWVKQNSNENDSLSINKEKFVKYLDEMGYSDSKKEVLMEMIDDGNYSAVAMQLKVDAGAPSVRDYVEKIREIFGEDTIYGSK
ncbi:MAG: hypothetical protein GXY61_04535 [Lentisphaerae bacterium]|nr:hypothetical protein [Lentisphaerota bacterium]